MTDQLSAKDWLDQGLKALAQRGFTALKAVPLAKAMGVSRGSFYWHFADIGAFHAAILKHWREVAAEQIIAGLEAATKDGSRSGNPISLLLRGAFGNKPALEKSVRSWATIDPKLLEILVCPVTKATLEYDAEKQELISRPAKLAYPIRDGIPIMLPEEARRLD